MKFKIKKLLTPRQLWKAKFSICAAILVVAGQFGYSYFANADRDLLEEELVYDGETFVTGTEKKFPRGRIVYLSKNKHICDR